VVGPYPVQGTWLPSRLPLEGTEPYPDFLGSNQWPAVPGIQDSNSSPRAFHRAGGRGCSLNRRRNRYSSVAMCAAAGFSSEAIGLKPP
jgi:hypothetical protein